jgi:hypothetical protein
MEKALAYREVADRKLREFPQLNILEDKTKVRLLVCHVSLFRRTRERLFFYLLRLYLRFLEAFAPLFLYEARVGGLSVYHVSLQLPIFRFWR